MIIVCGSLFMQLGSLMLDSLHPKLHLLIGGSLFVGSVLVSSYQINYYLFLTFYAFIGGVGYGIIYMLPLKNAYSFFPERKGLIGGIIMASYSFGAIIWSQFSAKTINPTNEVPSYYLSIKNSIEILYPPTSEAT